MKQMNLNLNAKTRLALFSISSIRETLLCTTMYRTIFLMLFSSWKYILVFIGLNQ
nr:MAG TPA: hypothetical protein [Caudoviricetes sp.]